MLTIYAPDYAWTDSSPRRQAVLVDDDAILAVGDPEQLTQANPDARLVDWSGLLLLPGFINAHCHSFQSLLRGFVTDQPFLTWRDRALYRYAPYLDEDAVYAGALLSFGEMLRYGVTTVADFFYVHAGGTRNDEAVIRAARDLGIRLVFARTMYNWAGAPAVYQETIDEAVDRTGMLAATYRGDPLISVCPAPHSPHGASPEMIQAGHRLAAELGTRFHIHAAEEQYQVEACLEEYGARPVQLLDRLGVLDESLVAVHLCWLSPDEIDLMGARRANLAYCPSSNMFLADGVTPIPELRAAGVRVGLGTDGLCSNNRASIAEEMRMAALLQKVHRLDATAVSAMDAFSMGTSEAANVLGLGTGRIAAGAKADFVGIDLSDLSMQPAPWHERALIPNVVYASQPSAVRRVVVGGCEVVRDGALTTVPEEEITARARRVVQGWPAPTER
jgi:5-methylthioadenosine/S-adenosylhomocysteine deaminase